MAKSNYYQSYINAMKNYNKKKKQPKSVSKYEYVIIYQSQYSRGTIIVDTDYYNNNIKEFNSKLKDCVILSMTERIKEDEA